MKRYAPAVLAALVLGALALAADMKRGTTTTYSQTVGGVNGSDLATPLYVDDAGHMHPIVSGTATVSGTVAVTGTDGGAATVVPGTGHWDCALTPINIITSTGPTNHGAYNSLPAGSYVVGSCSSAAYVGGPTHYVNDGGAGNAATCASRDAGAVFNEACPLRAANERFYIDLRNTIYNSIGATSVSGTSVCSLASCAN